MTSRPSNTRTGNFPELPDSGEGPHGHLPNGVLSPPGWISLEGYRFACMEEGKGEPILFIHGSLGTYLDFSQAVRHFARKYRAIAYSRRFHPPNTVDSSDREYTIARHAEDLANLLPRLHIRSAHMVGSSWGAYVALFLATRRPALVRTLVLGEPPAFPLLRQSPEGSHLLDMFQRDTIQPSLAALRRGDGIDGVRTFVDGVTGRQGNFNTLPAEARHRLLLSAEELRMELDMPFETYMPDLTVESLKTLTCPVLLLEGERSPRMFHLITDRLACAIPRAERVVIAGTGHIMHAGNPGAHARVIGHFVRRYEQDHS